MSGKPTLTAPFKNVKKNPKGFSYVEVAEVIDRLNAVLGYGGWSFEVPESFRDGEWIIAKGRLVACGAVYEQYGGVEISRYKAEHKRGGDIVDLSFEYKGAASEALKKCAMSLGVALYLSLKRGPVPFESVLAESSAAGGEATVPLPLPSEANPPAGRGDTPPPRAHADGEQSTEALSSPSAVSDPLERFNSIDAVNKRVKNLSEAKSSEWRARKPQPGPTFVAEALTLLDELEAVSA